MYLAQLLNKIGQTDTYIGEKVTFLIWRMIIKDCCCLGEHYNLVIPACCKLWAVTDNCPLRKMHQLSDSVTDVLEKYRMGNRGDWKHYQNVALKPTLSKQALWSARHVARKVCIDFPKGRWGRTPGYSTRVGASV